MKGLILLAALLAVDPVAQIDGPVQVKQGELVVLSYALSEGDGFEFSLPDTIPEEQMLHDKNDSRLIFSTNNVGKHKFELLVAVCTGEDGDRKIVFARTQHLIEVLRDPTTVPPGPTPPGPTPDPDDPVPPSDTFVVAIENAFNKVNDPTKAATAKMLAAVYKGLKTAIDKGTIKTVGQAIEARKLGIATALRLSNKTEFWSAFDEATVVALDSLNIATLQQVTDAFDKIAGVLE